MPVRIGKIELSGLSRIHTEDARKLVKQRGPGEAGGLFQDLGREPITVVMEGILLGDDTQPALEELRLAHANAKPMPFAADIVAGTELTHVLIADLQARQLAGHVNRYSFFLRVREYTEPPEPVDSGAAAVHAAAKADAVTWQQGAIAAAAVKQNPTSLMGKLDENPSLVAHLDAAQLGDLVDKNAATMSGSDFGKLLTTVGQMNPSQVGAMVEVLRTKGRLSEFVEKLSQGGAALLRLARNIQLGEVVALFRMIAGGADFLKHIQEVYAKAASVVREVGNVDLQAILAGIEASWQNPEGPDRAEEPNATAAEGPAASLVNAIKDLVRAVDDLIQTDTFKGLVPLVAKLGLANVLSGILIALCQGLSTVGAWLETLERIVALPRITEPLRLSLVDITALTDLSKPGRQDTLAETGWGELVPISRAVNAVSSLFARLCNVGRSLTSGDGLETSINALGKNMAALLKTLEHQRDQVQALKSANAASGPSGETSTGNQS